MYKFSVIVPVFQNYNIFSLFINSLLCSIEEKTQIILINDHSPDIVEKEICKLATLKNEDIIIEVINHDTNLGSAQSINEAFALIEGEFVVIIDSDTILKKHWQQTVITSFSSSDIGGVGGVLLYPQTNGIQCCGLTYTYGSGRHLKLNALPKAVGEEIYEVQSSIFAFFATKLNIIHEIGFLDQHYFNGYEDIDYQMRMRQAGYKIIINPHLQFYHWEKSNGIHREYNRRSNLGILWKRYGNYIKEDLWDFIFAQLQMIKNNKAFLGIDVCASRLDAETFWKQADNRMPNLIQEHLNYSYQILDKMPIWLPEIIHYDFFRTQQNLLFLCDNFTQLIENDYWLRLRQNYSKCDIIVDLYGNVIPFIDLKSTCWPGNKIR